jgi:hypothetical protein
MKLSSALLEELLDLGRGKSEVLPPPLRDEAVAWRTLVCGNGPWVEAARQVGVSNVPDLIRGLVRYSRISGRGIGGSVSPVVTLYRIVVEQLRIAEPELTRWIVSNRTNPYEPFGTLSHEHATTYAEYLVRRAARTFRASSDDAERRQRAKDVRNERERKESTERLANAVRRGDVAAVQALLDKGADVGAALPDGGSLVTLALANGRVAVPEFLKSHGVK